MNDTQSPMTRPLPTSAKVKARKISWPRSRVPMKAVMMTMNRAKSTVWLTPSMICGKASGMRTFQSSYRGLQPEAMPASTISVGALRRPKMV